MQGFDSWDGALLVDKPSGPTSHDVVDRIRRRFKLRKVGHCGTLDPAATGLLILVLGKGTRLSEQLMSQDKVYSGTARLGIATSTHDGAGEIIAQLEVPPLSLADLNRQAETFIGDLMQMPPMVSAVKIKGVPLYKLARKGLEVERKPRLIHIYNFRFTAYTPPEGEFRIACTKGTYVRSLIHELGQKIGCGAHLAALRRLGSGSYSVNDAIPLEDALNLAPEQVEERIIPFLRLVAAEAAK